MSTFLKDTASRGAVLDAAVALAWAVAACVCSPATGALAQARDGLNAAGTSWMPDAEVDMSRLDDPPEPAAAWLPELRGDMVPFDEARTGENLFVRSNADARRVIARSVLACPPAGFCPAWVGWLLFPLWTSPGRVAVSRCSAFLVAPDIVATAGHCVVGGVDGGVVLFSASAGRQAERIPVRRVLVAGWRRDNDSAFLLLARPTNRPARAFASMTPLAGAPIYLASVQAYGWSRSRVALTGVVRVQRGAVDLLRSGLCEVRTAAAEIVPGYSGSAAVDRLGRVIGILSAFGRKTQGFLVPPRCFDVRGMPVALPGIETLDRRREEPVRSQESAGALLDWIRDLAR